jgi:hypothetical protein
VRAFAAMRQHETSLRQIRNQLADFARHLP